MPDKSYRTVLLAKVPPGPTRSSTRKVMQERGFSGTGDGASIRKLIEFLDPPQPGPWPRPDPEGDPGKPYIEVAYDRSGPTFTVTGSHFLPGATVHTRVVNFVHLEVPPVFFNVAANNEGKFTQQITFPINVPQTYSFSANDGRTDSNDLTGTLWSNTVTITAT